MQWPGAWKGGRQIDRVTAHLDLLPTLAHLAAARVPRDRKLDGMDITPLVDGRTDPRSWPDRTLYFQCHRGMTPTRFQNCGAVTQRWKMVGYPNTFLQENFTPSKDRPALELYDLETDPSETRNLATENPEIVERLRRGYVRWFSDVMSTRRFQPGWIHLGSDHENPVRLCRYQDGNYRAGIPQGWNVVIERDGTYELTIDRGGRDGPFKLFVSWQGKTESRPLGKGGRAGTFELAAGRG